MKKLSGKIMLIGFGNPGRLDDGLGPALAEQFESFCSDGFQVETCYQLAVEHAEMASGFDVVIFADASVVGEEPFEWKQLAPRMTAAFTTHDVEPETILGLAEDVFDAKLAGYMLAIRGYDYDDFGEWLSKGAKENMNHAVEFLKVKLETPSCEII